MAKRLTEQPRCYYCHRFMTFEKALFQFTYIQNPSSFDPDALDVSYCDDCCHYTQTRETHNAEPEKS